MPIYSCEQFLPSGVHLGGQGQPRWAPEGREISHYVVVIDRFHCILHSCFLGVVGYNHIDIFWELLSCEKFKSKPSLSQSHKEGMHKCFAIFMAVFHNLTMEREGPPTIQNSTKNRKNLPAFRPSGKLNEIWIHLKFIQNKNWHVVPSWCSIIEPQNI